MIAAHWSDARFDDQGVYRYWLARGFAARAECDRPALFVMLNPSTADARFDDPTIRRCSAFAQHFGCDSLEVVNLYALRATDPRALRAHPDPIGPLTTAEIAWAATRASVIVAAWGALSIAPRDAHARAAEVLELLGDEVRCLGVTREGMPRHPLYLPASAQLEPYRAPRSRASAGPHAASELEGGLVAGRAERLAGGPGGPHGSLPAGGLGG